MTLPELTPEQVDLYLKLIGGVLATVTTIVVTTLLPAIRNFKTAQAAAPAQASSDMVTAAGKMAASVAMEALVKWTKQASSENRPVNAADHDRALSEGITAGLELLVKSGVWPTIAQLYTREKLLAALKGSVASRSSAPPAGTAGNGLIDGAISPEMQKVLDSLPSTLIDQVGVLPGGGGK